MEITWWHEALRLLTHTIMHDGTTHTITHEGITHTLTVLSWKPATGLLICLVDTVPHRWQLRTALHNNQLEWYCLTSSAIITLHRRPQRKVARTQKTTFTSELLSPLGGTVLRVLASEGDFVKRGTPLLVVESMKMENEIRAPQNCFIQTIGVAQNDVVNPDQQLMVFSKKGADNGTKTSSDE